MAASTKRFGARRFCVIWQVWSMLPLLGSIGCGPRSQGPGTHVSLPPLDHTVSEAAASAYAGSSACASCHARETTQWKQSRHAQTLGPYRDEIHRHLFEHATPVRDAARQVVYRPQLRAGAPVIEVVQKGKPSQYLKVALALGSGRVATTFMPWDEAGNSLNTRITNYNGHGWDWSPQQLPSDEIKTVAGAPIPAARAHECFKCHTTRMVSSGERLDLERSELGIGCESCHGPGAAHISQIERGLKHSTGNTLAPATEAAARCEPCHAAPTEPISPDSDPEIPRFKTTALKLSACRLPDGKPLQCVTCHDPHAKLVEARSGYDATCRGCHQAQKSGDCRLGKTSQCTSCHMPRSPVPSSPYVRFVNHWIRVYPSTGMGTGTDGHN